MQTCNLNAVSPLAQVVLIKAAVSSSHHLFMF